MSPRNKMGGRFMVTLMLELLVAFCLVAGLSLSARFVLSHEKTSPSIVNNTGSMGEQTPSSPPHLAVDAGDELRYNPARSQAYVKSEFATVKASSATNSAILDQFPYGSVVTLGGWDSGRKFVKIGRPPSAAGYVSINDLTYEQPTPGVLKSGKKETVSQTWKVRFLRHLSSNSGSLVDRVLDVDASDNGLQSQKSLADFFRILDKTTSKSRIDFNQSSINYSFLARDLDGKDRLIYPKIPKFISQIKNLEPTPGVVFDAISDDPSQTIFHSPLDRPIKLRFTKEPLGLLVRPLQELSNVGLSTFSIACKDFDCSLAFDALPSQGSTTLSALVMGHVERVKPSMVLRDEELGLVWVGFLDIDGDRQYDAAIYVGRRFADLLNPATVYVAENHQGSWRLKYIRDELVGYDSPQVSVEPGSHKMPINVRLYSDGGFGVAYTIDGSEPSCTNSERNMPIVKEAEFFIEQSTSINAKTCGGGLMGQPMMTFNYDVKK